MLDGKRSEITAVVDRILDHGSSVRDAVETQAERLGDQVEQSIGRFREHMTQLAGRIDEATETSRHETKTMIQATEASQREFTDPHRDSGRADPRQRQADERSS